MMAASIPGPRCPLHHHHGPDVFRTSPVPDLCDPDIPYVVGGLHGQGAGPQQACLAQRSACSKAHASCFDRIVAGPDHHAHQVIRLED